MSKRKVCAAATQLTSASDEGLPMEHRWQLTRKLLGG
jgi:hypothetical protein